MIGNERKASAGSDAIAEELELRYEVHSKAVRGMVASIVKSRDAHLLDDVTQEVWVHAVRKAHSYKGGASFNTWLVAIAKNVSLNHLRAGTRRARHGPPPARRPSPETPSRLDGDALRADLEAALRELRRRDAAVFRLVHLRGLRYSRVRVLMRIATSTLKLHMENARKALRPKLAHWAPTN